MAPELKHPRSSHRAAVWLTVASLTMSLAVSGCSSASRSQATTNAQSASADSATSSVAPPRQIESLELRAAGVATALDVEASRPLVWTSYRDSSGNLVIELPNSEPIGSVEGLRSDAGLVAEVRLETEISADRPLTRLTIVTREEAEHTLAAEAGSLELQLTPLSATGIPGSAGTESSVAAAGEVSYEPLPRDDRARDEPMEPVVSELQVEPIADASGVDPGAPDVVPHAVPGPPPAGRPATVLRRVSVENGTVRVTGDGNFAYITFALENPARFVIDLKGVVNTSSRASVAIGRNGVKQVRVAQFKPFPEAVSRVVFDLERPLEPSIEATEDGLLLHFGEAPRSASVPQPITAPTPVVAEAAGSTGTPVEAVPAETQPAETEPAATQLAETQPTEVADTSDDWRATEPWPELPPADAPAAQPAETEPVAVQPVAAQPAYGESGDVAAVDEPASALDEPRSVRLQPLSDDSSVETAEPTELPVETPVQPLYEEPAAVQPVEPEPVYQEPAYEEPAYQEPVIEEATSAAPVYEEPPQPQLPPLQVPLPGDTASGAAGESLPPAGATSDVAMFEAAEVEFAQTEVESEPETTEIQAEVVGDAGQSYKGPPISLSLKDSDIKDVLRSFATFTGLNVVVHPGVQGSVTVELREVPWDQALDLILKINGLDYVLEGNIMRIATSDTLAEEARARRALLAARAQEIPLATVIRSISYANAQEIATLLQGSRSRGILSSRGSVTVDQRTNKLIIKELPGNLNTVLAVIDNLDTAEPQVLIEARIVETTKQFTRSLGVNWSFDAISDEQFGNTTGLQFPHQGSANGGVQLLTGGANGFLDINLGNVLNTFQLDLSLQAAESEGLASVLSAPRIATLNNQQATIQSGLQIPIQTVANNTVTVQFVNATLELGVTPQITPDGTVIMDISIAKREPQPAFALPGATNAPISTKEARTRVIVRDGGTTVIGGIYEISNDRGEDRVPGLANVPILGHLFKNRRRGNNNEELLIFITPRVIQL